MEKLSGKLESSSENKGIMDRSKVNNSEKNKGEVNSETDSFGKEVSRLRMMMERLEVGNIREILVGMNKKVGDNGEKINPFGSQAFSKACIVYRALPEEGQGGLRRDFFLKYFTLKNGEDDSESAETSAVKTQNYLIKMETSIEAMRLLNGLQNPSR